MTWLRPWAWIGAVTLLLPVLIHLLGRGRNVTHRFPSLRFIEQARLLPAQRSRLQDVPLLLLRLAVLLAAVAALAQPRWRRATIGEVPGRGVTRAVIIDTSASMQRATPAGGIAQRVADERAAELTAEAATSRQFRTASPQAAIPGAVSWLAGQSGRREVVVISDFQRGTLDSASVVSIPASVGVRLIPVAAIPANTVEQVTQQEGRLLRATVAPDSTATTIRWDSASGTVTIPVVPWEGASGDSSAAAATLRAAMSLGVPLAATNPDTVVLIAPTAPERDRRRAQAGPLRAPWMIALVAGLREESLLRALAGDGGHAEDTLTPAVWSRDGAALLTAAADGSRLLLFLDDSIGSPFAAGLAATVLRLQSAAPPLAEAESMTIDSARLRSWERAAGAEVAPEAGDAPDAAGGRWLWLAVLLLLGAESWARRRGRVALESTDAVA